MIELNGHGRFDRIRQLARESEGVCCISGISESRSAAILGVIAGEKKGQILAVTSSHAKAKKLAEDLSLFVDKNVYVLPEEAADHMTFEAKSQDVLIEWLFALSALASGENCIVVASPLSA